MSVLEDLIKRILKTGEKTGKKARDVADVIGLNASISGSQSRLRDLQQELGLFMAESVFTDLDKKTLQELLEEDVPERTFAVKDWKELYQKLLYLRSEEEVIAMNARKISKIRGDKHCPVCGAFLLPDSRFCPQCGSRIVPEEGAPAAAEPVAPAAEPAEVKAAPAAEPAAPEQDPPEN